MGKRRKEKKSGSSRSRKKHKRLDAICEEAYTRNHSGVQKVELVEGNMDSNEMELRRSNRVRRPPVVLDASPAPPKKRQKIDKKGGVSGVEKGKRVVGVKSETPSPTLRSSEEALRGWRSRLRSRGKRVSFKGNKNESRGKRVSLGGNKNESPGKHVRFKGNKNGDSTSKGRRKLFENFYGDKKESELGIEETGDKEQVLVDGTSNAEQLEAAKVLSVQENEDQEDDSSGDMEDDKQLNEETVQGFRNERTHIFSGVANECVEGDGSDSDVLGSPNLVHEEDLKVQTSPKLKERHSNDGAGTLELDMLPGKQVRVTGDGINAVKIDAVLPDVDQAKDGELHDKPLEDGICENLNKNRTNDASDCTLRPLRIKEGRQCGLCGGGTNGKPPKKLVHDGNVSDEAYSGGSASEEPNYDIWDGFGDEPSWLGRLLGPINDRFGIAGIWVHQQCAVWSPEVWSIYTFLSHVSCIIIS